MRLDHVQIAAPLRAAGEVEAAARAFFSGLLGLDELPKPPELLANGGAWFQLGSDPGSFQIHVGVDRDFHPATKAHVAFELDVRALDALAERLDTGGHPPRWDARVPGIRRFFCDDPWGNRMEFYALT